MRPLTRFRESAISCLFIALVALGFLVALKAHDDQAKGPPYREQVTHDSGGEDDWLSSLSH